MYLKRMVKVGGILGLLTLGNITQSANAATTEIGTYKFEAVYTANNTKLIVSVSNTSGRNRDAIKCFSLRDTVSGQFNISTRPGSGWYFPDHVSACGVLKKHAIHAGSFEFAIDSSVALSDALNIGFLDRDGHRSIGTIAVSGNTAVNQAPVANAGQSRVISDSDGFPGEEVLLNASLSHDDKGIVLYEWYIDNILIATGVMASVSLEMDSNNTIELLVQDEEGLQSSDYINISVSELNLSYNGVTPPPQYQLAYNNIAVYKPNQQMIFLCINIPPGEGENTSQLTEQYNLNLRLRNTSPIEFSIDGYSEFNPHHLLNEFGEEPDCSGQYNSTTGLIEDFVQFGSVLGTVKMQLNNSPSPMIQVLDFEWLNFGQE